MQSAEDSLGLRLYRALTDEHQLQPRSDDAVPLQTKQPRDNDDSDADNKRRGRDPLLHVCISRAVPLQVTVAHALVVEAPARPTDTRDPTLNIFKERYGSFPCTSGCSPFSFLYLFNGVREQGPLVDERVCGS